MDFDIDEVETTFEGRLEEYFAVFANSDKYLISQTNRIWAAYLRKRIEPSSWLSAWIIPRERCGEFLLSFPRTVYVTVEDVDYDLLSASVSVIDVEQNRKYKNLPKKVTNVMLKDLYVVKDQRIGDFDHNRLAECLDQLRIFYNYLLWPWDEENGGYFNSWVSNYLTERLRLYYDILEGKVRDATAKKILSLLERGKKIHAQLREFSQTEEEYADGLPMTSVIELNTEFEVIKRELQRWGNLKIRKAWNIALSKQISNLDLNIIVPEKCSLKESLNIIRQAAKLEPGTKHKHIVPNLNTWLKSYESGDKILVCAGKHDVSSLRLDFDVRIRSLFDQEPAVICENVSSWYLLKASADDVRLQNIILELKTSTGIVIKDGFTYLESVIMKGDGTPSSNAVIVEKNGTLFASGCQFTNFHVAIICLPGSAVELNNCKFHSNDVAIEFVQSAQLCMSNCDLSSSNRVPFRVEGDICENTFKPLESLSSVDSISVHEVKLRDHTKAVEFL